MANATVTVKGTNRITQYNKNGVYSIQVQKGEVLVIISIGLKTNHWYCSADTLSVLIFLI